MKHMDLLPPGLRSEGIVGLTMLTAEITVMILSFVFAFRVRKLRRKEQSAYLKNRK